MGLISGRLSRRLCDINKRLHESDQLQLIGYTDSDYTGYINNRKSTSVNVISIEDYMKFDQLQLIGYTDSDYAGCIDNEKSTSSYIFLIVERW